MESMGKKPRRRRSFTPEFKAEIVELCQRGDRSVGQVARDFDLTETAVREWVKQAGRDAGTRQDGGLTSSERRRAGASCGGRTAGCARTWRSSSGRRLSSRRRPGELLPVHRGGESTAGQRQVGVRAAEGLPCRLLCRSGGPIPAGPGQDAVLAAQIRAVHKGSKGRYGAPRVHAELRRKGHRHCRKRVARLMRQAGWPGGRRSDGRRPRSRTRPPRPAPTGSAATSARTPRS